MSSSVPDPDSDQPLPREPLLPTADWPEEDDLEDLPPVIPLGGHLAELQNQGTMGWARDVISTLRVSEPPPSEIERDDSLPLVPGYQLERILGRGGMGVVYLATDRRLGRQVAIKMISLEGANAEAQARFQSEGQLLASVDHPGVAKVFEVGFDAGRSYLVMEFIDGQTLSELTDGRPLSENMAADFAIQLSIALHACHEKQIIHRDVKPSNALVDRSGRLKLTDFGLAKLTGLDNSSRLTQTGDVMGTPAYMSPEQASGVVRRLGPTADVYSVGAVLYELVTGRPPFISPEPLQTVLMVLSSQPVAPRALQPSLSFDLENIILKCLEKSPQHRYDSCRELADDLRRFVQREPVRARPIPWRRKALFWVQKHPAASTAWALTFVLVTAALIGFGIHNRRLKSELERTQRMVDYGRNFSRWLLYDFSKSLETDTGLTSLRQELAAHSEEHLNQMEREVVGDHALRLAIADAQVRLAQVQHALGGDSDARANLKKVIASLPTAPHQGTDDEKSLFVLATIRDAEIDLELQANESAAEKLQAARSVLDLLQGKITDQRYSELFAAWAVAEVQLAGRQGDLAKLERLIGDLNGSGLRPDANVAPLEEILNWEVPLWSAKGSLLIKLGKSEQILEELFPVLSKIRERAAPDTQSLGVKMQVAVLERFLSDALFQQQDFENALKLYGKQRGLWTEARERDPNNLDTLHNLALACQHEGDCLLFLDRLDEAKTAFDTAQGIWEARGKLTGKDWRQNPEIVDFLAARAHWHTLRGEMAEAIELNEQVISLLRPVAKSNVLFQQILGESLLLIGLAKSQQYSDLMNLATEDNLSDLQKAYREAQATLKDAEAHFQAMQTQGVLSPQGTGQLQRAAEMQTFLAEMHKKLMATFDLSF